MAKKRDTFGDSPLGSGGRFAECVEEMKERPGVYDPAGLCAYIGRRAYGKGRFQKMAQRGRERGNPPGDPGLTEWHGMPPGAMEAIEWRFLTTGQRRGKWGRRTWPRLRYRGSFRVYGQFGEVGVPVSGTLDFPDEGVRDLGEERITEAIEEDIGHILDEGGWEPEWWYESDEWEGENPYRRGDPYGNPPVNMRGYGYARQAARELPPPSNPCGAGGYGPAAGLEELEAAAAANPVKGDGRWHRSTLGEANTHQMRTQKGVAICFPYRPRKFPTPSRALEDLYQREHGRKLPAGTKWLSWIRPGWPDRRRPSAPMAVTAHKTLDEAKRAGESALRKLPVPEAGSNPAELIGAGILAGSAPIPSGIDSPRVPGGILAGSRPIPSGFGDPRVNVGLVDPPLTRRSKPEQPL